MQNKQLPLNTKGEHSCAYRDEQGAAHGSDEALSRKTDKHLNLNFSSLDRRSCDLKYSTSSVSSLAAEVNEGRRGNISISAICLKEGNAPYFFKRNHQ